MRDDDDDDDDSKGPIRPNTPVGRARPAGGKGRKILKRRLAGGVLFQLEVKKCYKVVRRKHHTWVCRCMLDPDFWHPPQVYAHDTSRGGGGQLGAGGRWRRWLCSGWSWADVAIAAESKDPRAAALAARAK